MEYIDEIDWDGNTITSWPKSELKKRMFPHKISLIIPRAHDNKFILSRRAKDQEPWPDTWVCAVGGKCIKGESFEEGAIRESKEEVGKELDIEFVDSFTYNKSDYQAIFSIYTTKESISILDLDGDPREIQHFKEVSLEELESWVNNTPKDFAPTFIYAAKAFVKKMKEISKEFSLDLFQKPLLVLVDQNYSILVDVFLLQFQLLRLYTLSLLLVPV